MELRSHFSQVSTLTLLAISSLIAMAGCSGMNTQPPPPPQGSSQPAVKDFVVTLSNANQSELITEFAITKDGVSQLGSSVQLVSGGLAPSSLQSTPGHLYVNFSSIDVYQDNPAQSSFNLLGQVNVLPGQSAQSTSLSIDPSHQFIYAGATNGDGLSICGFRIQQDGTLVPVQGSVVGRLGDVGNALLNIVFSSDETKLYAMDFGCPSNQPCSAGLVAFNRDPQSGALSRILPQVPPPLQQAGDFNLFALQNGKFLANFRDNGLGIYAINSQTGDVTEVPGSPFPLSVAPGPVGSTSELFSLASDATGQFVYISIALNNSLTVFELSSNGSLMPVTGGAYTVASPDGLTVTSSNQFLAVTSSTGSMFVYQRDGGTGLLTPMPGSPVTVTGTLRSVSDLL